MSTTPHEAGTPERLVAELLAACRRSPGEAAALLWEAGAEKLRRAAGSEQHLERLLANEIFAPLIGFERIESGPLERIEDSARQSLTAHTRDGGAVRYLLSLKRAGHGDRQGDWLITGLEREW